MVVRSVADLPTPSPPVFPLPRIHSAASITREGGKGQTVWGEGFWGGTEELEAKMHVRKIMVAGTRTVSRIK